MNTHRHFSRQAGLSMIEILITMVVLAFGLLGLAGLMVQSQHSGLESYQRVQALILLQDMYERINTDRAVASCYAYTNTTTGSPYLGTGSSAPATCTSGTANQNTRVATDLTAWDTVLKGSAEKTAGSNIGAMVGARGCISYDGTNLLNDSTGAPITGTGVYTLSVAWQGLGNTFANTTLLCGTGLYDNEASRRVVSLTFRIGAINNTK